MNDLASLNKDQRDVLETMAALLFPVNRTQLVEVLNGLDFKANGRRPFTTTKLAELLDPLVERGVVGYEHNQYQCVQAHRDVLTLAARDSGVLEDLLLKLPRFHDLSFSMWDGGYSDMLRELRIRIVLADVAGADLLLAEMAHRHKKVLKHESPVLVVLADAQPALMVQLPAKFQAEVLRHVSSWYLRDLTDTAPLVRWMIGRVEQLSSDAPPQLVQAVLENLIPRGQLDQARELLDRLPEGSGTLAYRAWLALLQRDGADSVELFSKASRAGCKQDRTWAQGVTGVMDLLAKLSTLDSKSWTSVTKTAKSRSDASNTYDQAAFEVIRIAAHGLLGEQQQACTSLSGMLRTELSLAGRSDWNLVFWAHLSLYWLSHAPSDESVETLREYAELARERGWLLFAAEADELLWRWTDDRNARDRAASFRKERQIQSLVDIIPRREPWQQALDALAASVGPIERKEVSARIAWLVTINPYYQSLAAIEQRRHSKSGWTKGRPVAMKRMHENPGSVQGATDADRRVFGFIRKQVTRNYGYPEELFSLDTVAALRQLGGHRAVFLEEGSWSDSAMLDPIDAAAALERVTGAAARTEERRQVDVVVRRPVLRVDDPGDDTLILRLDPPADEWDQLRFDEQGRLCVCAPTKSDRGIAEVLPDELDIPSRGREKAREVLSLLAGQVEIQSDVQVGATASETVEPDARLRFRLVRKGEGLEVRVVVAPLGGQGPTFAPGKGPAVVSAIVEGRSQHTTRSLEREIVDWKHCIEQLPSIEQFDADSVGWQSWDLPTSLLLLTELQELGESVVVEWPRGARLRVTRRTSASKLRLRIHTIDEWFEADGALEVDDDLVLDVRELLERLSNQPGPFVELESGQFLALTEDFRRRLDRLAALGHGHGRGWRLHSVAAVQEPDIGVELGAFEADAGWTDRVAEVAKLSKRAPAVPRNLCAELRDYQVDGFRWMARLAAWGVGACLADDMGLGKTVQALAVALKLASGGPTLVVAPTSVCMNWAEEIHRFAPSLVPVVFGAGDRDEAVASLGPRTVLICSYGLLLQNEERLLPIQWQMVVLDEAQAVKNDATKRAKSVRKLRARFRLATTGTPIENNLEELWSLFQFLLPGLLGTKTRFRTRFANPIQNYKDGHASRQLRQLVHPFILRRTKAAVLHELPPRTDITRRVTLAGEEAATYEALRIEAEQLAVEFRDDPGQAAQVLAAITKLRRAACHPRFTVPDAPLPSAKLEALGEILDELASGGHRALIFSQFVDHLQLVRTFVESRGVALQYLDGSTPMAQRSRSVDAWQAGEGDVFLISLRAGGFGLNLTAADYVVHMDPWWNPAVEDQASDRTHRIGQQRPVTVYRLIAQGTIEERILGLHEHKRELAEGVLEGSERATRLSMDELLGLIRASG